MKIVFKNLSHSDLVQKVVEDRFALLAEKFPYLGSHQVTVTLEMENSPLKPGRDSFSARVLVQGKKFHGLNFTRTSNNLYAAVAEAADGLQELLHRENEKYRGRARRQRRLASPRSTGWAAPAQLESAA